MKTLLFSFFFFFFLFLINPCSFCQDENGSIAIGYKQGMLFSKPFSSTNLNMTGFNQNSSSLNFSVFYLWANASKTKLHSTQIGYHERALHFKQDTINVLTTESIIDTKFTVGKRVAIANSPISFDYFMALTFKALFNKKYYADKVFNENNFPKPGKQLMFNIGIGPELNINCHINKKSAFFFNQGFQMDMLRIGKAYKPVSTLFFDYYANVGLWFIIE